MASIVLLLSELLGGTESASVPAASCYVGGGHCLREFRPAAAAAAKGERAPAGAKQGTAVEAAKVEEPLFEDLAALPRIAVDVMWP